MNCVCIRDKLGLVIVYEKLETSFPIKLYVSPAVHVDIHHTMYVRKYYCK